MKQKSIFMLLTLLLATAICTSCGKDDDDDDEKLEVVKVRVFSEDIAAPNGQAYLFYVEKYADSIEDMQPSTLGDMYSPWIGYNRNLVMYPVSDFGGSTDGQLMVTRKRAIPKLPFIGADCQPPMAHLRPAGMSCMSNYPMAYICAHTKN